ncbi:MAG: hypothetical protein KBD02_07990 [Bacteroides sp.]|nr:hypothetical protein [Bacteroides sp.]
MNIETLENDLRKEDIYTESEIMQILSFMFALSEHLPPTIEKPRNYFNKFLVSKASHLLDKLSEGKFEYRGVFENCCETVLNFLIPKFANKEINWKEFMKLAKERIEKEICGIKKKITDIANAALEKALLSVNNLDISVKEKLIKSFNAELKIASR